MAETTATQPLSVAAFAIICAVLAMHDASPTDVPPNFITCSRGFISSCPPPPMDRQIVFPRRNLFFSLSRFSLH
jgi:hypothetical protein